MANLITAELGKTLKKLRLSQSKTQRAVAGKLGLSRSTFADYENGKSEPNMKNLVKIADYYGISLDRLVRGKSSLDSNFPNVLTVSVDAGGNELIEFVPVKASAGYLHGYSDPDFVQDLYRFSIPKLGTGTYRAFEITGDSMNPEPSGSIVIAKYISDLNSIKIKEKYIVVVRDQGILYKRLHSFNSKTIILSSDNKLYPQLMIRKNDLIELWEFCACINYEDLHYEELLEDFNHKVDSGQSHF